MCDGAEAGTVGEGRPIRALNIAVSGTDGVSATAAYVREHWRAGDRWKAAEDQKDLYIGDKKSDHPMQGFSISIPGGSACFEVYAKDVEWIQEVCTPEGKDFYAGAPMEKDLQLEAVRLKV
ncbi:hypothetical protein AT728_06690 [Streptomyces silvensis]|uniref:Uncharacterized protein n=1 Tax=Streptomyces silvensis TaxID=1765722 RepID=A0A0W7X732_9ACTN|nr:hypothetical protein AT728_06690 [Streptomyces silvensis]